MLLDDECFNGNFISTDDRPAVFLKVDEERWSDILVRSERWEGVLGCGGFLILLALSFFSGPVFFLSVISGFFVWKMRSIYIHKRLYRHADFTYEIKSYKLVRYSLTNFDVFSFEDLSQIRRTTYGIHFEKAIQWWEWLWPSTYDVANKRLLILPEAVEGFDDILNFLEELEEK